MVNLNHQFHILYVYKNLLRGLNFQLVNSLYNPYSLGRIKVNLASRLFKLDNLNSFRVLGSFVVLGLLTNQKPAVARIHTLSSFRVKATTSKVELLINVAMPKSLLVLEQLWLTFVCNLSPLDMDIIPGLRGQMYSFVIKDLTLLKGVETHPVFFKWKEWVTFTVHTRGFKNLDIFLKTLKLL